MADLDKLGLKHVAGGAAGALTVTGIKLGDRLLAVTAFGITAGAFTGVTDQTAEFTVTADNTISNVGGTATTAKVLLVAWVKTQGGRLATTLGRSRY